MTAKPSELGNSTRASILEARKSIQRAKACEEKHQVAKARFKAAKKDLKQAKKAAKKAAKEAQRAQEQLKILLDHSARKKKTAPANRSSRAGGKRRPAPRPASPVLVKPPIE